MPTSARRRAGTDVDGKRTAAAVSVRRTERGVVLVGEWNRSAIRHRHRRERNRQPARHLAKLDGVLTCHKIGGNITAVAPSQFPWKAPLAMGIGGNEEHLKLAAHGGRVVGRWIGRPVL